MKQRILFVDDEQCVLNGLKRLLHPQRNIWEMHFVDSGEQALVELPKSPFDIIVSDMRMPGMDGSALLEQVRSNYPDVVRIILSGQAEQEAIVRAIGPTQQYLSKPCQPDALRNVVSRACALRATIANSALRSMVGRLATIPTPSQHLAAITEVLLSSEPSVDAIAAIASNDIGLTCKLLQLVNSSFFGFSNRIEDVKQAIAILGISRLRPIFLSAGVFSGFQVSEDLAPFHSRIHETSWAISSLASEIIRLELPGNAKLANETMLAGLVLDAGQLILASELKSDYLDLVANNSKCGDPQWLSETRELGVNHAGVGAYLLGIWGFSDPVVEAVAYHHEPSRCVNKTLSPLTAVHVASCLVAESFDVEDETSALDWAYLDSIQCDHRIDAWRRLAELSTNGAIA